MEQLFRHTKNNKIPENIIYHHDKCFTQELSVESKAGDRDPNPHYGKDLHLNGDGFKLFVSHILANNKGLFESFLPIDRRKYCGHMDPFKLQSIQTLQFNNGSDDYLEHPGFLGPLYTPYEAQQYLAGKSDHESQDLAGTLKSTVI